MAIEYIGWLFLALNVSLNEWVEVDKAFHLNGDRFLQQNATPTQSCNHYIKREVQVIQEMQLMSLKGFCDDFEEKSRSFLY